MFKYRKILSTLTFGAIFYSFGEDIDQLNGTTWLRNTQVVMLSMIKVNKLWVTK